MKNDNSKKPDLDTQNVCETSEQRRQFIKQVLISGTGAITFVKSAEAASSNASLPAIISLLLEEEEGSVIGTATFDPTAQVPPNQALDIPTDAKFMQVDAYGAGGGGGSQGSNPNVLDAGGGDGGHVRASYDIRQFEISTLFAQIGTGGGRAPGSEPGDGGRFGGGNGGNVEDGVAGGGGGGFAGLFQDDSPIIISGGGGGGGGFRGRGGSAGARAASERRAGEDGGGVGRGGNRRRENGISVVTIDSLGGRSNGETGSGRVGGRGGSTQSGSGGGGGGAGLALCGESSEVCSGAGGSSDGFSGAGGGAGGTNFIDTDNFQPLAGFNDDVGSGGTGGRAGESGAPAQIVITFFDGKPSV